MYLCRPTAWVLPAFHTDLKERKSWSLDTRSRRSRRAPWWPSTRQKQDWLWTFSRTALSHLSTSSPIRPSNQIQATIFLSVFTTLTVQCNIIPCIKPKCVMNNYASNEFQLVLPSLVTLPQGCNFCPNCSPRKLGQANRQKVQHLGKEGEGMYCNEGA